jgi:PAS domain S-box-containing protein
VLEVDPLDIVETIREGLLVLDPDLTIGFANRTFCDTFAVAPEDTVGRKLYEIGNGEWDTPKLRTALKTIISGERTFEDFEVDQFFPAIGRRVMCFNALKVYRPGKKIEQILLAIEDVTERVRLEREHAIAHEHIGLLLQELTHRVKNSLQIIASMVRIEARSHKSGDGKAALERVSHRIDALGHLYAKLSKADTVEAVDAATYLDELCRDLISSVHSVNAGEILQRPAGVKVQHGRKQEGPRCRGPSCLSGFIPEGQRRTAILTGLGVKEAIEKLHLTDWDWRAKRFKTTGPRFSFLYMLP